MRPQCKERGNERTRGDVQEGTGTLLQVQKACGERRSSITLREKLLVCPLGCGATLPQYVKKYFYIPILKYKYIYPQLRGKLGLVSFDVYIVLVYLHADAMSTATCMSVHKRLSPEMYQDAERSLDEWRCMNITSMLQKATSSWSGEIQRLR